MKNIDVLLIDSINFSLYEYARVQILLRKIRFKIRQPSILNTNRIIGNVF